MVFPTLLSTVSRLLLVSFLSVLLQARDFLRRQHARPGIDWASKFPTANADVIGLLKRLLTFFPEDRISAEEALAHPAFASIRDPGSETSCARPITFDAITPANIQRRMYEEIMHYN